VAHYSLHNLNGSPRLGHSAADTETKLAPGAGLVFALLLSLGLWGAIWLAAHSLAAAWPW